MGANKKIPYFFAVRIICVLLNEKSFFYRGEDCM